MQNRILFQMLMAATMTFGIQTAANAQFGKLKGLASKAKSAVSDKASGTASGASSSASSVGADDGDMPSANGVVWRWENKDVIGQSGYDVFHNTDHKMDTWGRQLKYHNDVFTTVKGKKQRLNYWSDFNDNHKMLVPVDEIPRYAWTKVFVDNPTVENYKMFAQVVMYMHPNFWGDLNYVLEDPSRGIISTKEGTSLPWASETDMISERRRREEYALEIAKQKVPLKDICDYINLQYRRAEYGLQHPESQFVMSLFVAEANYELLMKKHKDYKASAECVRSVEMNAAKWDANNREMYRDLMERFEVNAADPVALPSGVSVSADIKAKGDAAAKKWAGLKKLEYVKTIYLGSKWREFKNPKFPYNVTHHAIEVAVVCKMGDKTVMEQCDLQKSLQGQYSIVPAPGARLMPVK